MAQSLPNILSIARIIASVSMLFFFRDLSVFIPLYLFCGISDVLDGYIARKYESVSTLGARIDSVADVFFYIVLLLYFYCVYGTLFAEYIYSIPIILLIKFFALVVGILKYRKIVMLHTWANKASGLLVFLLPIAIWFYIPHCIPVVLVVVFLASVEELLIILKAPREGINLNKKSAFTQD